MHYLKRKMKLYWIHVQFGGKNENYYRSWVAFFAKMLGAEFRFIVVENSPDGTRRKDIIRGTNILREFSGWNEGVKSIRCSDRADWYVFSNDTFAHHRFFWGTLSCGFIRRFRDRRHERHPTVIGDFLPGRMLGDGSIYAYASTYLFMMNEAALDALDRDLIGDAPTHWIWGAENGELTSPDCPPRTSDFLKLHLTTKDSAISWRSAAPLSAANASVLRFKALAVLLEHWLSRRVSRIPEIHMVPVIDRVRPNIWRLLRAVEVKLTRRWK